MLLHQVAYKGERPPETIPLNWKKVEGAYLSPTARTLTDGTATRECEADRFEQPLEQAGLSLRNVPSASGSVRIIRSSIKHFK